MTRLPLVSGKEAVHTFQRTGWSVSRREGSHIILTKVGSSVTLSVPDHRELRRGTLRSLIRHAEMTVDEFITLLRS